MPWYRVGQNGGFGWARSLGGTTKSGRALTENRRLLRTLVASVPNDKWDATDTSREPSRLLI